MDQIINRKDSAIRAHMKNSKKNKKPSKNKRKRKSTPSSNESSTSSDSSIEIKKKHKFKTHKKTEKKRKDKKKKPKKERIEPDADNSDNNEKLIGPAIPNNLPDQSRRMVPETKEEWEKRQNMIRRVYDETTGRHRLIKGDGEILEEIVSKERHKEINKQATFGDGQYFQSKLPQQK